MSKLLQARTDLLNYIRIVRMDMADIEMDVYNNFSDDEVYDLVLQARDSFTTVLFELDAAAIEQEDDPDHDVREDWLI